MIPPGMVPGSPSDSHLKIFDTMHKSGYRSYHIDSDGKLPEISSGSELATSPPADANNNYLFIHKEANLSDML